MCLPPGGIECGAGYCDGDHTCINGQGCLPSGGTACGSGYCVGGLVCLNGQCERACDAGTTRCGQDCVDVGSNPSHCGGCGVACASGQVCAGGVCSCPDETELCGGECVNPLTDLDHCGACDTPCQTTACMDAACVEGQCQRAPIPNCCTEDTDCDDGNPCTVNSCDTETSTCGSAMVDEGESCPPDTNPCTYDICDGAGQCTHPPIEVARRVVCMRPEGLQGICVNGDCVVGGPGPDPDPDPDPCETSTCSDTCCEDDCVNLQTDPLNCGACGEACADDETCVGGICNSEAGCDISDWLATTEWTAVHTLSYDHVELGATIHEEMTTNLKLRLTPWDTDTSFLITAYEGTCAGSYSFITPWSVTEASGSQNVLDFSPSWLTLAGGVPFPGYPGHYYIDFGYCQFPGTTTSNGITSPAFPPVQGEIDAWSGGRWDLPVCPGPISGEFESHFESEDHSGTGKMTWSLVPAPS